jgi:hypothetical protein
VDPDVNQAIKASSWLITVSTNKRPSSNAESERLADALAGASEDVLNDPEPYLKFIAPGSYDTHVVSVDSTYSVELGPEGKYGHRKNRRDITMEGGTTRPASSRGVGGRIHSHILLEIKHRTKLRLDYTRNGALRQGFVMGLRERGVDVDHIYLDVKVVSSKYNLLRYLGKDSVLAQRVESSRT